MTQPRRKLLRPQVNAPLPTGRRRREVDRLRSRLQKERTALVRWTSRLKRAFHAFERQHDRITRLEKRLTRDAE